MLLDLKSVLWCRPQSTMNVILTELRMPSKGKGKDGLKRVDNPNAR